MYQQTPPNGSCGADLGPNATVIPLSASAQNNRNFRTVLWTGCHLQLTVMSLAKGEEIGWEQHPDTDQLLRIESGESVVEMGCCRGKCEQKKTLQAGDAILVPAGTWHNVRNTGCCPLRLSSVYAPAQHPRGTIHRTKADAEK